MPYIGNVLTSFAVETGNINDQAVTAPKLSATGGTNGQVLALDSNLNLEWVSDPAGQWVTSGSDIYYNDGNVGIGTTSPSQLLDISSSGNAVTRLNSGSSNTTGVILSRGGTEVARVSSAATDTLTFSTGSSASERMRIDSSGQVGIGTTSPAALLELGTSTPILRFSDTDTTGYHQIQSSNSNFIINADPSNETASSVISFKVDGSEAARIDSDGNVGIGTTSPNSYSGYTALTLNNATTGSLVDLEVNGTRTATFLASTAQVKIGSITSTFLRFDTNNTERMRIDSSGNVGIGTSSPAVLLDVTDSSGNEPKLRMSTGTATNFFQISRESSTGHYTLASEENGSSIILATDPDGTGAVDRLTVDRNGNVGIGTTSPDSEIHISKADTSTKLILERTNSATAKWSLAAGANSLLFKDEAANSERMRIDSSGRVLIGLSSGGTSPLNIEGAEGTAQLRIGNTSLAATDGDFVAGIDFHIKDNNDATGATCTSIRSIADQNHTATAKGTALTFHTTADDTTTLTEKLRIHSNGNLQLTGGTDQRIRLNTSGAGGNDSAHIRGDGNAIKYNTAAGSTGIHIFENNGSELVRMPSTGGITFNGDTATANALDDYEEGTFTPTIDVSGSSGTLSVSYASQTGRYIKVGRTVFFTIDVRLSNFSRGTGTGGIIVFGLPHVPVNTSNFARSNGFANLYNWNYSSTAADIPMFVVRQTGNQSYMDIKIHRLNNTDADVNDPDNDSMVFLTGTYETVS